MRAPLTTRPGATLAPAAAPAANGRSIGGTTPAGYSDDLWVVIVEIDRTETGSSAQNDRGSFTLTAKDDEWRPNTLVPCP